MVALGQMSILRGSGRDRDRSRNCILIVMVSDISVPLMSAPDSSSLAMTNTSRSTSSLSDIRPRRRKGYIREDVSGRVRGG